MEQQKKARLEEIAKQIRIGIIEGTHAAKSGHPGGSLSITDVLTYLYFEEMNIDPANPQDPNRDRFVLSKGHCAPALYATLANRGYFPVEELTTLRKIGSRLQGHPDMTLTPGVDMSAGSLGLGISSAAGMALAGKIDGKNYRVYTAVGDGENDYPMFAFARHSVGISLKDKSRARVNVSSIDEALDHLLKEDTE